MREKRYFRFGLERVSSWVSFAAIWFSYPLGERFRLSWYWQLTLCMAVGCAAYAIVDLLYNIQQAEARRRQVRGERAF